MESTNTAKHFKITDKDEVQRLFSSPEKQPSELEAKANKEFNGCRLENCSTCEYPHRTSRTYHLDGSYSWKETPLMATNVQVCIGCNHKVHIYIFEMCISCYIKKARD